jgi:hypothetical protein
MASAKAGKRDVGGDTAGVTSCAQRARAIVMSVRERSKPDNLPARLVSPSTLRDGGDLVVLLAILSRDGVGPA